MSVSVRSSWQQVKLKDVCREITVGYVGSMASEYVEDGVIFLRSQNILPFQLNLSETKFISEAFHKKIKKSALFPGDIVIVRTGYPGTACVIPPSMPATNCADLVIVRASRQVDPYYLANLFNSAWGRGSIAGRLVGAAQQHFNVSAAKEMIIDLPPLPIQRQIAAILSAYDDLIENNTRRIAILEEMARSLYQEWFVKFRFPGHEAVKMVESELGMIPEGWEVENIGNIIDVIGGGTPSTKNEDFWDNGDVLWYSPTDLTSAGTLFVVDSAKKITPLGLRSSSARLFPAYSVMMTSRATIGVIAFNTQPACTNQGFITCIPNQTLSAYQIYHWLLDNREKIMHLASGATFKEINKATFRQLPTIVSEVNVSQKFNDIVTPIYKEIENLTIRNANLRRTRDLLLPRLIAGEIDVERMVEMERECAVVVAD